MFALVIALLPAASAETHSLVYALTQAGRPVGERTLTVRYLGGADDLRLLESTTSVHIKAGPLVLDWEQRLSGVADPSPPTPFASIQRFNGVVREIQVVEAEGGWTLSEAEGRLAELFRLPPGAFQLTTLDLMDPGRVWPQAGPLTVLAAEGGALLAGTLARSGAVTVRLGAEDVAGEAWVWTTPDGDVDLVVGEHGHLLQYTLRFQGMALVATLTGEPGPRTWGEDLVLPPVDLGGVREDGL